MHCSIRHMDKSWNRSSQVEERMRLDGAFPLTEKGSGEKREVDRGRIESVNRVLEIQSEIFVLIESTGFGEGSGEAGEDSPVARFAGMGQVVA